MSAVSRVTTLEEFESLDGAWNEAVERDPHSTTFQGHEWLCLWWRYLGNSRPLSIAVARDGAGIAGAAPLFTEQETWHGLPVRLLRFLLNAHPDFHLPSDLVLADPERALPALVGSWAASARSDPGWDFIVLDDLREASRTLRILPAVLERARLRWIVLPGVWNYELPVNESWNAYARRRGKHFRDVLRNSANRLERQGAVRCEVATEPGAVREGMDHVAEIDARSWKRERTSGASRRLHEEMARLYAQKGECDLRLLWIDRRPVAYLLSLRHRNKLFAIKTGYDDDLAYCSPGAHLIKHLIETAPSLGITVIDFLSERGHVERWSPERVRRRKMLIFHRGLYSRWLGFLVGRAAAWRERVEDGEDA